MRDTHEIWKPIRETEGKYSVSNMGRVKNNETGTVLKGRPRKEVICEQLTTKKNTTYE